MGPQLIALRRHPVPRPATAVDAAALEKALRARLEGEVRFSPGDRALYATDGSNYRQVPIGVVIPRSLDDVIATVEECRRHGAPLLSRGGGTSLAGQCCNVAVVIDWSKYVNQIVSYDPAARRAVVQPGLVLDRLRERANQDGLTFPPDPSTHAYCTLGGMIGNNSCGVHSVMGGRTVDNVEALEVLTYDGVRLRVGPTSDDELERLCASEGRVGQIYRDLRTLRDRYARLIRARYPQIPRRVSGYSLDELLPENGFNVARALVGAEGTCVTVLEATVRLLPWPKHRSLLVLGYPSVYEAGDHVVAVRESGCIGLEGLDDRLVEDMMKKHIHPKDTKLLPDGKGWLMVEFGGDSKEEADAKAHALMARLAATPHGPSMKLFDDQEEEKKLWHVRESGLGATARVPGQKRDAWEGWEDAAVPPSELGSYLREFRALLERYDYGCALYGHFGDGCVHTRIDFDLRTADGVARWRGFMHDAAELVVKHGGSLSGEHGDGQSRGELLPIMYGHELVDAFRQFKHIWDPDGAMNPGKKIDGYRIGENLRLGPHHRPAPVDTHFSYPDDDHSFARVTERCVGVGKCRRANTEEGGSMCPSYQVTHEEKHSTRGRAHLLFEMMQHQELEHGWHEEAVKDALDLCLACKGCKTDCPMNVDMATYKAEFLSHYYAHKPRPITGYTMGLIYWWARLASKLPRTANFVSHARGLGWLFKRLGGVAIERDVPRFAVEPFKKWWRRRPRVNEGRPKVILWADTFNNYFTPATCIAAVETLEAAGYQVVVPEPSLCCGRPLYDYGFLDRAKKLLRQTLDELRDSIEAGVPVVGLEPSCVAVFRDEMCNLLPQDEDAKRLGSQTFILSEFLADRGWHPPQPIARKVILHGHCHHKAVLGFDKEQKLLQSIAGDVETLDAGCCGMAGAFGYERAHYDVSQKCGERVLLPKVREADKRAVIVTDGFSCREQVQQATDRTPMHFAELCKMALDEHGNASIDAYPERRYVTPTQPASGKLLYAVALLLVLVAVVIGVIVSAT
ncbi:MAG TPA: FAD-binding and (Fe-S)-binding domain-containing protein [Polyangia bacterium]|nr:FAD-binding and (Fe-S)-binding domain-containing protein [Polyangia bacterium]